jgi:hypothetical protein
MRFLELRSCGESVGIWWLWRDVVTQKRDVAQRGFGGLQWSTESVRM